MTQNNAAANTAQSKPLNRARTEQVVLDAPLKNGEKASQDTLV
jgi:hypothetical protein